MHRFTKKEDDLALSLGSTGLYRSPGTAYLYLLLLQASFYQPIPTIVCLEGNIYIITLFNKILHETKLSAWCHQSFVKHNG